MAKPEKNSSTPSESPIFAESARILTARMYGLLSHEACLLDERKVLELHEMRIGAKRLRYSQELFLPLYETHTRFGANFKACIKRMKRLQDLLGAIHDADITVPRLTAQLEYLLGRGHKADREEQMAVGVRLVDFDACQGLLTLCIEIREEREAWFREIIEEWSRLKENRCFEQFLELLVAAEEETSSAPLQS